MLGEHKLRIMQLEDELAARDVIVTSGSSTSWPIDESVKGGAHRNGMREGLPKQVVELLKAFDRPLSSKEIGAELGCELVALYQRIPLLVRSGRITRQGRRKHYVYSTPRREAEAA
jgi:hypothetical protein